MDNKDITDIMQKNVRRQNITLIIAIIANFLTCLGIIFYYRFRERSLIGYVYTQNQDFGKKLAGMFFNLKAGFSNSSAGIDAMEAAGYGRNGFYYASRFNGELLAFALIIAGFAAALFFAVLFAMRLGNRSVYTEISDIIAENELLKTELENEKIYYNNQYQKLQDFIENIAHQIKTPLAAIALKFDMLKVRLEKDKNDDKEHMIELVNVGLNNTFKIKDFIKKLLDISRIEYGKVIMAEDEIEIDSLLVESIHNSECEKETVITAFNDDSTVLYADESWLIEAFVNILNNCNDAIRKISGGEIFIDTGKLRDDKCIIKISDNGKGLENTDFNKIFDRFETDASPRDFRFGIGMNLSKLIIESHHGKISAGNSEKYGGMEFVIELPIHRLKKKF